MARIKLLNFSLVFRKQIPKKGDKLIYYETN